MDAAMVAVIGAGAGVATAGVIVAGFWMALGSRIGTVEATSDSAIQVAAESEVSVKAADERITMLASQFALYREGAIEKFVTHQAITELEKRLVESQAKSEQRFTAALEGLYKRLDRLIEAGLRQH